MSSVIDIFAGRMGRNDYWVRSLACFLLTSPVSVPLAMGRMPPEVHPLFSAWVFACFLYMIPVTVKRLHDRGMPGWWLGVFVLLDFIPYVNLLSRLAQLVIVGFLPGTKGDNPYGRPPSA